jgi:Bacterial PH domain
MPADSEPAGPLLPRTWRPLGVRLAVVFFGGLLAVVCVAGWVAVGADVRAKVTVYQQATVVLFAAMAVAIAWGLYRCRVTATSSGLEVVNGYRTHHYEWPEVLAVHMPQGAPFPTLDLADGTSRPTLGIQSSDGDRARQAVRELRTLVARTAADSLERPDPPAD